MTQRPDTSPSALVDALNAVHGRHAGRRAWYAKGFCAVGEFVPDPDAGAFVANALFAQPRLAATLRFSVGSGAPGASDRERSARGLALRLDGAGQAYDLVLASEPVFGAATLESFVGFLRARVPLPGTGRPDPARIAAYEQAFPDGARLPARLAAHAAPASHATTPYYSNHAFLFTGRDGRTSPARLLLQPDAGTRYLSAADEAALPDDFLEHEMDERLLHGPIGFGLHAQLPGPGDSLVDPSTEWQGRHSVALGRLLVTALSAASCDPLDFAPAKLPPGIALSDDPILQARAAAYLVSANRRTLTRGL